MKLKATFFSSLLIVSISLLTLSTNAWAEKQKKPERWFEIEVILFKQLADKALLKEHFPNDISASTLPHYKKSFDLLTAYLQPDVQQIKQFIPRCNEKNEPTPYLEALQPNSTPFFAQMQLIEQVPTFNMPKVTATAEQSDPSTIAFDLQKETLANAIFSTQKLCVITQQDFERLLDKEQLANFDINAVDVDSLPPTLKATGTHIDDSPYLIADDSLLLKDINQGLGWSKEFKPLLHFGWRQVGLTQKKAIPLKLFAGEHLTYKYQQALADHRMKKEAAKAIEKNVLDKIAQAQGTNQNADQSLNQENVLDDASLKLIKIEQKQQALNTLFSQVKNIEDQILTLDNTIDKLGAQSLNDILSATTIEAVEEQQLDSTNPPKAPLQPWFLDGFIKIHLDHYLYITADFNVLAKNQAKVAIKGNESDNVKLINFSQNRRVITGEVHYFDHPYIGMIVQIRRFDPTKPIDEAVTQAIK